MNEELRALLDEVRAVTAEVQSATREQRATREAERAKNAKADEELAERRRKGELGRDWQVLQQRIDMNRTTVDDILGGMDKSDEARAVRAQIQREALPRARADFAEAMAQEDMAGSIAELREAQEGLQQAMRSAAIFPPER